MSTITQAQLDSVEGLSSREAAKKLGVGKSTINKYRSIAEENNGFLPVEFDTNNTTGESLLTKFDGSLEVETKGNVPQTKGEIDAVLMGKGFDPEKYDFSYRFSEWEAHDPTSEDGVKTMYAARASATPKRANVLAQVLDATELLDAVNRWEFTPVIREKFNSVDMPLLFADPQLGKVDVAGDSNDTVNQILESFANAVEIAKEEKPHDILFADLGDGLENFYNTSSQRETNDLDLTGQVRVLRRIQAEGLRMLAPYCNRLKHRSVPSNHGGVRIGFQQQASTESNDWGLEVSFQLEDVFAQSQFTNIDFARTVGNHAVSLRVDLENGSRIGMSHGDQAGTQPRLGTWWMNQAFGWDNPLRDVDILLIGHFHNQAVEEVFEGRHLIVGASSDRGSSWFTNRTGRSASSGMTTFLTAQGKVFQMELI
jgi:hypothetical protein